MTLDNSIEIEYIMDHENEASIFLIMPSIRLIKSLPQQPLLKMNAMKFVRLWTILHFITVFIRENVTNKMRHYERGIKNLVFIDGMRENWTPYKKTKNKIMYVDSLANLPSPVVFNFKSNGSYIIIYNHNIYYSFNSSSYGNLCLHVLQ